MIPPLEQQVCGIELEELVRKQISYLTAVESRWISQSDMLLRNEAESRARICKYFLENNLITKEGWEGVR